MSKDHDSALLEACKQGDRKALDSLVRRYERPVFNAAYRMLGNPDEAADVTQTVFLKAFENLQRYDARYKFFSWIYRIAVNESIDRLNQRKHMELLDERLESDDRGPAASVESERMDKVLQSALLELSEDHRAVIVLRHFTEYSYREIGVILGIEEKTVKSRLFSARQNLRECLENRGVFSA